MMFGNQPYPTHAVPELLYRAGSNVGSRLKCPDELIAQEMQGLVSACVQSVIQVDVPVYGVSPTNLWILSVVESGGGKSAVKSLISKGVNRFVEEVLERYRQDSSSYQTTYEIWRAELDGIRKKLKRHVGEDGFDEVKARAAEHHAKKPPMPSPHCFSVEEFDGKALIQILATQSKYLYVDTAEASSFLNHKRLKDAHRLIRLYSGEAMSNSWTSSSLKSYNVSGALGTLNFMVQPKPFADLLADSLDLLMGNGFLARFLPAYPLSQRGRRFIDCDAVFDSRGIDAFNDRAYEILCQAPYYRDRSEGKILMGLSPSAKRLWVDARNEVEAAMAPGNGLFAVPEFASRLANNLIRMAANWQYFQHGNAEINSDMMSRALEVCRWHAAEFVRMFAEDAQMPEPEQDAMMLETCLWKWNRERSEYQWSFSYLRPRVPRPLRKTARLTTALSVLVAQGRVFEFRNQADVVFRLNHNCAPIQLPQLSLTRRI